MGKVEMTKRQIRISDTHFKELEKLSADMGLKKAEIMGLSISLLKSLRTSKAKSLRVVTSDGKEIEVMLPVDVTA